MPDVRERSASLPRERTIRPVHALHIAVEIPTVASLVRILGSVPGYRIRHGVRDTLGRHHGPHHRDYDRFHRILGGSDVVDCLARCGVNPAHV